jgi:hypothetical protein
MAAEAVGLLVAAVAAERRMAVAERHVVVAVAVHTAIVNISAFQKDPSVTNEAGLFCFFLPTRSKSQCTTLSFFACSMNSSSPGVSEFDKAFDPNSGFLPEGVIV